MCLTCASIIDKDITLEVDELFSRTFNDIICKPTYRFLLNHTLESAVSLNVLSAARVVTANSKLTPLITWKEPSALNKLKISVENDMILIQNSNGREITLAPFVMQSFQGLTRLRDAGMDFSRTLPLLPRVYKSFLRPGVERINVYYTNAFNAILQHLFSYSNNFSDNKQLRKILAASNCTFLEIFQGYEDHERICMSLTKSCIVYEDQMPVGAAYTMNQLKLIKSLNFPATPIFKQFVENKDALFYCLWTISNADIVKKNYTFMGKKSAKDRCSEESVDKILTKTMPLLAVPPHGIIGKFLIISRQNMDKLIQDMRDSIPTIFNDDLFDQKINLYPISKKFKAQMRNLSNFLDSEEVKHRTKTMKKAMPVNPKRKFLIVKKK